MKVIFNLLLSIYVVIISIWLNYDRNKTTTSRKTTHFLNFKNILKNSSNGKKTLIYTDTPVSGVLYWHSGLWGFILTLRSVGFYTDTPVCGVLYWHSGQWGFILTLRSVGFYTDSPVCGGFILTLRSVGFYTDTPVCGVLYWHSGLWGFILTVRSVGVLYWHSGLWGFILTLRSVGFYTDTPVCGVLIRNKEKQPSSLIKHSVAGEWNGSLVVVFFAHLRTRTSSRHTLSQWQGICVTGTSDTVTKSQYGTTHKGRVTDRTRAFLFCHQTFLHLANHFSNT